MPRTVEFCFGRQWHQHLMQLNRTHTWHQQKPSSPLTLLQLPAQLGSSLQRKRMQHKAAQVVQMLLQKHLRQHLVRLSSRQQNSRLVRQAPRRTPSA
jgi:hypothetical protein